MKKSGILFTSELDGELLAGSFNLKDERNMRGLIGASKRLEVEASKRSMVSNANRLLEWETIKHGKENEMKSYDFGGYYVGEAPDQQKERINDYKRSFGGKLVRVYDYHKDYSMAIKFARAVTSSIGR